MAASPEYKVYNKGEYVAACKYATDAAILCASYGAGTTIKYAHKVVVWTEGQEAQSASESYDYVADTVLSRVREFNTSNGRIRSWSSKP